MGWPQRSRDELRQRAAIAGIAARFLGRPHRLGQCEELSRVTMDVQRVGHHAAHRAARLALDLVDPVGEERLGRMFFGYRNVLVSQFPVCERAVVLVTR